MGNSAVIWENQIDEAMYKLRFRKLKKTYKDKTYHYVCRVCEYNHFLKRYYPKAELVLVIEHLNNNKIKIMID